MQSENAPIVIVDDEPGQRQLLDNALQRAGYATVLCQNGEEGLAALENAGLLLLDVRLPGLSGIEVLEQAKRIRPELPVILMTAFIDVRDAVLAIKNGALDYLEKPVDLHELIAAVDDALGCAGRPVSGEATALPPGVVAESKAMRRLFEETARAAVTDAVILVLGESGTGKQVLAEFVRARSHRAEAPFITVNCGAIPANLIESELFGHEKGAFTGAEASRAGCFEAAHGGTLFLDEIGELPLSLQPAFLRVLETGRIRSVGGDREREVDVRIIAATNRNLEDEIKAGRFREDLYYRLNIFPVRIPPLRERPEDILPLAQAFLAARKKRLAPAAERILVQYAWPGNIRELKNALERANILSDGSLVLPTALPLHICEPEPVYRATGGVLVGDLQTIQKQAILEALETTKGNKTRAAKLLGISRRNLIYKLRDYDL